MSGFCGQSVKKSKIFMEILDFFLFWHGHCKLFRSVISFSVINYVVSMRCPRVSDDSSFFLRFTQKNELKLPTPPQSLRDSPGGACRTVDHGSGVSETTLHSVSPTLRLEPYCALRKNSV